MEMYSIFVYTHLARKALKIVATRCKLALRIVKANHVYRNGLPNVPNTIRDSITVSIFCCHAGVGPQTQYV